LDNRSCVRDENDEIVDGIVPVREVEDKSSNWRDAWSVELEESVDRGLASCCELTTLEEKLE